MAWYDMQNGQNMGISSYMTWGKEEGRENSVVEVKEDMREKEVYVSHVLLVRGEMNENYFIK